MAEALQEEAWAEVRDVGVGEGQQGEVEAPLECAVTCPVCLKAYDGEYRRPILLPFCGHTFCRSCIKNLVCEGGGVVCPCCRHEYKDADFDNFPVNFSIQILASSTKNQQMKQPSPHECQQHGVRMAFWCRSCEVPACGECLFDGHPRPAHTICKINDVIKEVKTRAEELVKESTEGTATLLGDLLRGVVRRISDLQEAGHILQECGRLRRTAQDSKTLSSITRAFESAKSLNQRVETLKNCDETEARQEDRPVVVALSETGGVSRVKVEERGVHIYSLRPSSTAYTVAIKISVLLSCMKKEAPAVFLDLRAGDRPLGRVYITLYGQMRRAQQFLALCLGTFGPSYRDTRFDGVSDLGQPGEYIRGGDYSGKKGLGGEALMDNLEWGGQWTRKIEAGQVCGVGGEDEKKFGALFAICLRGNPQKVFRAPFGMVTNGLDVLAVASRHKPFDLVRVADCGVCV